MSGSRRHLLYLFAASLALILCFPSSAFAINTTPTTNENSNQTQSAIERSKKKEEEQSKAELGQMLAVGILVIGGSALILVVSSKWEKKRNREVEQIMKLIETTRQRENEYYAAWVELNEIKRKAREEKASKRYATLAYRPHPGKASRVRTKKMRNRSSVIADTLSHVSATTSIVGNPHKKKRAMLTKSVKKRRDKRNL